MRSVVAREARRPGRHAPRRQARALHHRPLAFDREVDASAVVRALLRLLAEDPALVARVEELVRRDD